MFLILYPFGWDIKSGDFAFSFLSGGIELPKEEKPVLVLPVIGLGGSSFHPQVRFLFFRLEKMAEKEEVVKTSDFIWKRF